MIFLATEEIQDVVQSPEEVAKDVNQFVQWFEDQIPTLISFGIKVVLAIVFFFIGRAVIHGIQKMVKHSMQRANADTGVIQFVESFLKFGLYALLLFMIATNFGIETSSVAALIASGGVAIGLALQGSLSNFAGGVLILLLKPFVVGDYIIVANDGTEGTVKVIQIFYTKLTTVDNKTIVIPNGTLSNSSLTNVTARPERQLDLKVGIAYDADLAGNAGMRAEGTYDAVTSATGKKWNSMFADTTYSSEADENGGGKILGVSGVEVAIEQSLYDQLTADAKDSKTSGVLGSLFAGFTPNEDQTVVPAAYKQLFADGTLSATITAEPEVDLTNVTPTLKTDSKYGDYQLKMDGLDLGEGNLVYGVIVKTKTGSYGMLQLENIWKGGSELAWSAGFKTTEVHGNSLRSTPYAATSGDTIVEISYLTSKGEYSVHLADGLYLPKKHNGTVTAESVAVTAGSIPVTLADLPEDFSAVVSADTLTGAAYADGKMAFDAKSVLPGSYTITVSDESGVYAPLSTSVILTTDAMPAAYDAEKGAVVAAKGAAADDLAAYLKNVSKVTVNDTTYEATGKRGVKIIDPTTGEIHADAETRDGAVFTKSGTYKLTVEATGYTTPLTFEVEIEVTDSRADVDLDGRVDSTDVFYMMLYTANISAGNADFVLSEDAEKNKQMIAAADVDGNGSVDSTDAFYALYYVASKGAGVNVTWEDIIK